MRKVEVTFVFDADTQSEYGCKFIEMRGGEGFAPCGILRKSLFHGTMPMKAKAEAKPKAAEAKPAEAAPDLAAMIAAAVAQAMAAQAAPPKAPTKKAAK